MNQSIVDRYRNKVEPWKRQALTQEAPGKTDSFEESVRMDYDTVALDQILVLKYAFIRETANRSLAEVEPLYFDVFDIFAMDGELIQLRQWLLQPPTDPAGLDSRLEGLKVHVHDLHYRSRQGDNGPAMMLAFMNARTVSAEMDKLRTKFALEQMAAPANQGDHELFAGMFCG